ncbi:hypothetical protein, partial [Chryseobacterium rhizosphaerae]
MGNVYNCKVEDNHSNKSSSAKFITLSCYNKTSIWTSWTSDPNVARDFATNYGTSSGVVLSKRFKVGVNAIPNVSPTGNSMQEREWLIFGPVIRAGVQ